MPAARASCCACCACQKMLQAAYRGRRAQVRVQIVSYEAVIERSNASDKRGAVCHIIRLLAAVATGQRWRLESQFGKGNPLGKAGHLFGPSGTLCLHALCCYDEAYTLC